jgi:hypothetical protein
LELLGGGEEGAEQQFRCLSVYERKRSMVQKKRAREEDEEESQTEHPRSLA